MTFRPCPKPPPREKKQKKYINRISKKKKDEIELSKEYYKRAIEANKRKNGNCCRCDECHVLIKAPTGRNVAHILSGAAYKALYLHPENHFILCFRHVIQEESGDKKTMSIYPEWAKRRDWLLRQFYRQ